MRRWLIAAGVCAFSATQATAFLPLLDGSRKAGSGVALWAGPGRNVYGSKSSGGQGGAFGRYGRDDRRRNKKAPEAEASKDPKKRVANLTKKLNSILELEKMDFDELNDEQRAKLKRKEEIRKELSRLTKLVDKVEYVEEAADKRKEVQSAADLAQDVVGGNIPRTLLKLLTYCRVSDKDTCQVLLELGKVKVNGKVVDDPVAMVDLVKDVIEFDGDKVTLPQNRLKHRFRAVGSEGEEDDDGVPKDYCAKLDGGLLIDLTRQIEKAKGTYVDKSPYIMRERTNNNRRF